MHNFWSQIPFSGIYPKETEKYGKVTVGFWKSNEVASLSACWRSSAWPQQLGRVACPSLPIRRGGHAWSCGQVLSRGRE